MFTWVFIFGWGRGPASLSESLGGLYSAVTSVISTLQLHTKSYRP
jgi:hypothetical protein